MITPYQPAPRNYSEENDSDEVWAVPWILLGFSLYANLLLSLIK